MDSSMMSMSMSMSMSASASPTQTTSGMDMASSTMDMMMPTSSSGSMSGMTMDMSSMSMVFFTATNTPLYSSAWAPTTVGQYAGTCVFLVALATIFRALLAIRIHIFQITTMIQRRRNVVEKYVEEDAELRLRPWRAREATLLAFLDVILAGVGYLLMLAVMTMNLGYFLSILAGVFIGSMAFARYISTSAVH